MAKCNCNKNSGCYGALDALCRQHEYFYNRTPCTLAASDCDTCETSAGSSLYYTGCCPSTTGGEYGNCCCCRNRRCRRPCVAQFIATAPLTVDAGGRLPLRPEDECRRCRERGGRIYIEEGGLYLATFTFLVPSGVSFDTRLALSLDNGRLFASETSVVTSSDSETHFFGGQAVFEADGGEYLSLESTAAINIPMDAYAWPLATVVLLKLN